MEVISTSIQGLFVADSALNEDARGHFARIYCDEELKDTNNNLSIVQMNLSGTHQVGTIRGMHFQYPPYCEVKMVRCLRGKVFDVAVDLRKGSKTFLHWHGENLSAKNWRMMIIPEGFAHGFQVLEEDSELLYLHSAAYQPENEGAVRFDDPRIKIKWPLPAENVSKRDGRVKLLSESFDGVQI